MSLPLARGTCLEVLTQKYFSELTVLPRIELQSVVQVKHLPLIASTSASHLHLKCRLALLCKFVKKMLANIVWINDQPESLLILQQQAR